MNWLLNVQTRLEKVEMLISDKPFLKEIIEEVTQTHVDDNNFDALTQSLSTLLGKDNPMILLLLRSKNEKNFDEKLTELGFNIDFTIWLWTLSLKYGTKLAELLVKSSKGKFDIKNIEYRILLDDFELIEYNIERIDGEEFILECRLDSSLRLAFSIISSINSYFSEEDLSERDKRIIRRIILEIKELLEENTLEVEELNVERKIEETT
ncbi:hypothetical protein [Bacillus tropicus]|uniref:hypothetical protein n=1 Tax=Bacillus tropicus TaxID=2026188 RepID=UPI001CFDDD21|nr:hypothetical protein [Bacillus tropicus]